MKPDWEGIALWSDILATGMLGAALYLYIRIKIAGSIYPPADYPGAVTAGMLFLGFWVSRINSGLFIPACFGMVFVLRKLLAFVKRITFCFMSAGSALCRKLSPEERKGNYLDFAYFGEDRLCAEKKKGDRCGLIDFMDGDK